MPDHAIKQPVLLPLGTIFLTIIAFICSLAIVAISSMALAQGSLDPQSMSDEPPLVEKDIELFLASIALKGANTDAKTFAELLPQMAAQSGTTEKHIIYVIYKMSGILRLNYASEANKPPILSGLVGNFRPSPSELELVKKSLPSIEAAMAKNLPSPGPQEQTSEQPEDSTALTPSPSSDEEATQQPDDTPENASDKTATQRKEDALEAGTDLDKELSQGQPPEPGLGHSHVQKSDTDSE